MKVERRNDRNGKNNIEERLKKEVEERVAYYEEHEPAESEKMSKIH